MTKTKAQLRREAVERLKMLDDNTVYYEQIADAVANNFACTSSYKLKKVLIDLLTDDEPPEGDAVAIMRKVATCGECTGYTMRKEVGSIDWADALLILADMIERDYVRRDSLTDDEAVNGKKPESLSLTSEDEAANCKKPDSLQDSREKLEKDFNQMLAELVHDARRCCTVAFHWDSDIFHNLLDRQANITRRECSKDAHMAQSKPFSGVSDSETCSDSRERVDYREEQDSREKLESDVRHFANYWAYDDYLSDETVEEMRVECMNELRELLDRQAAITERECDSVCDTCRHEQVVALQERVDALEEERKNLLSDKVESDETCESFARHWEEEKKARKAATRRYDEKNTRQIMLKLNLKTDADILEKLDSVENRQGYIKELIRRDICGDNQKSNIPQMLLRYGDSIRFRCFVGDIEYEFGNLHIEMLKETTKKEICGFANEYDCAGHKVRMLEKRIRIE